MLAAILLNMACESDKEIETVEFGTGDLQWIQFDQEVYSISEGIGGAFEIPVLLASGTNESGVNVQLTFTSASNASDFVISPADGNLTIPAGEFTSSFTVTPVDNLLTDGSKVIEVTVSSSLPIGLPGSSDFSSTTITITDDDCPLDINEFVGTYTAEEDGYCNGCYEVTATLGPEANTLVLENVYDTGGTTIVELDNSDPSNPQIFFRSIEFDAALQVNPTFGNVWATDPGLVSGDPADNISSFLTCTQYMDLWFRRCVGAGCFAGTVHIQLRKN